MRCSRASIAPAPPACPRTHTCSASWAPSTPSPPACLSAQSASTCWQRCADPLPMNAARSRKLIYQPGQPASHPVAACMRTPRARPPRSRTPHATPGCRSLWPPPRTASRWPASRRTHSSSKTCRPTWRCVPWLRAAGAAAGDGCLLQFRCRSSQRGLARHSQPPAAACAQRLPLLGPSP